MAWLQASVCTSSVVFARSACLRRRRGPLDCRGSRKVVARCWGQYTMPHAPLQTRRLSRRLFAGLDMDLGCRQSSRPCTCCRNHSQVTAHPIRNVQLRPPVLACEGSHLPECDCSGCGRCCGSCFCARESVRSMSVGCWFAMMLCPGESLRGAAAFGQERHTSATRSGKKVELD